jgi:hypothetical protein
MADVKIKVEAEGAEDAARAIQLAARATDDLAGKAKRAEGETKKASTGLQGFKKVAQGAGFGGPAGDIEDMAEGLSMVGPQAATAVVGLMAVAGVAYGIYAVTDAMYDLALGLEETDAQLAAYYDKSIPGFTQATDEAIAASGSLNAQTEILTDIMAQGGVIIAERVAPAYDKVARFITASTLAALDAFEAYGELRDQAVEMLDALTAGSQMRKDMDALAGSTGEYGTEVDNLIARKQILARVDEVNKQLQDKAAESTREYTKTQREAERALEERERAEKQLNDTLNGLFTEFLEPLEQIDTKYDDIAATVSKLGATQSDLAEVVLARHMAKMAFIEAEAAKEDGVLEDVEKKRKRMEELAQAEKDFAWDVSVFKMQLMNADMAADQAWREEQLENVLRNRDAILNSYDSIANSTAALLQVQIDAAAEGSEAQKKAAIASFYVQQGLAGAQIGMDTARAIMAALADPTLLGPAKGVAVAAAVFAGATQAGIVASQSPPEFHEGGEVTATLLEDEFVNNRRSARNHKDELDFANKTGRLPAQDTQAWLVLGDRVVDDITSRGMRGPKTKRAMEHSSRTGRDRAYR